MASRGLGCRCPTASSWRTSLLARLPASISLVAGGWHSAEMSLPKVPVRPRSQSLLSGIGLPTGVGSAEGFVLAAQSSWDALLTSSDGQVWISEPLGAVELWADRGDEAGWAANRTANGARVDRIRCRDGRATVAHLEDVENFSCFSSGPAGVAVAALTASSADRPALMESITRVADGRYVRHRGYSSYLSSEVWVGWSAVGAVWKWQTAADAFGINPRMEVSVELAVGRDFVLARVVLMGRSAEFPARRHTGFGTRFAAKGQFASLPSPRWFIGHVPKSGSR